MDFVKFVEQCDADLRAGKIDICVEKLSAINCAQVPREFRLPLANLCRRCGQFTQGFRLLSPLIGADVELSQHATSAELAEYAVLLMKNGSVREAVSLLRTISPQQVAEAPMYLAFCEMFLWNYDSAAGLLRRFLADNPSSYQAMVARVNLAAALVWTEHWNEARDLLDKLILDATTSGSLRLKANCLELRGNLHLQAGDLARCEADLAEAREILLSQTSDQLFVRKWQAALLATKTQSAAPLRKLRTEAVRRQEWESVRDCDFYILKYDFDQHLFEHLICGTPFESFRKKVCRHLGREMPTGAFHLGTKAGPNFDLRTGVLSDGASLNCGKKVHQTLAVLLNDFYKPVSLGAVFSSLFPDEHFNVYTSPGRIHQLLSRTRKYVSANELPIHIDMVEGGFLLRLDGNISIQVDFQRAPVEGAYAQLERLKRLLPADETEFSSREASRLLHLSESTAKRVLRWGVEEHKVQQQGAGPSTRYRLVA